jgi:hypothetical protein
MFCKISYGGIAEMWIKIVGGGQVHSKNKMMLTSLFPVSKKN